MGVFFFFLADRYYESIGIKLFRNIQKAFHAFQLVEINIIDEKKKKNITLLSL